jgi:hypothetical protein
LQWLIGFVRNHNQYSLLLRMAARADQGRLGASGGVIAAAATGARKDSAGFAQRRLHANVLIR